MKEATHWPVRAPRRQITPATPSCAWKRRRSRPWLCNVGDLPGCMPLCCRLVSSHPASNPFVRVSYLLQRPNCSSETLPWVSGNALEPGFVRLPPRNWVLLITSSISPLPLIGCGRLLRHTCRAGTLLVQQQCRLLQHSCCTARVFYRHSVGCVERPRSRSWNRVVQGRDIACESGVVPVYIFRKTTGGIPVQGTNRTLCAFTSALTHCAYLFRAPMRFGVAAELCRENLRRSFSVVTWLSRDTITHSQLLPSPSRTAVCPLSPSLDNRHPFSTGRECREGCGNLCPRHFHDNGRFHVLMQCG